MPPVTPEPPDDDAPTPVRPPTPGAGTGHVRGPQADRDLLALHALHRRQLLTAFLHGSTRHWRDTRRIWPAVVTAAVLIALAVAAIALVAAFRSTSG